MQHIVISQYQYHLIAYHGSCCKTLLAGLAYRFLPFLLVNHSTTASPIKLFIVVKLFYVSNWTKNNSSLIFNEGYSLFYIAKITFLRYLVNIILCSLICILLMPLRSDLDALPLVDIKYQIIYQICILCGHEPILLSITNSRYICQFTCFIYSHLHKLGRFFCIQS